MKRVWLCLLLLGGCGPILAPPNRETVELRGTAYERGLQHGTVLRAKVRGFYTTLLTNSLFPYLSREQPDIASFLPLYATEKYQNGQFAYQLMLDSAKGIEHSLPRSLREEFQGIADGSGLSYEQILVLNTFVDTVLAVRGIALAIRLSRAPVLKSIEFVGANADGVDNDDDGDIDETGEGVFDPYVPDLYALAVELAPRTAVRLVLTDPDGIDAATVRVFLSNQLYTQSSPEVVMTELSPQELQVLFTPSIPLKEGEISTLVVGAGDKNIIASPAPAHASFMRDEEMTITTRGTGLRAREVRRPALTDGRTRPPPFALGVRHSMKSSAPFIAQHFSLLDANSAHKHTVALRHVPDDGPAFVTIGWAGVVSGFSGLSERGVGFACNPSDSLDNSIVGSVLDSLLDLSKAKLVAHGMPISLLGRTVLQEAHDARSASELVANAERVSGWTCVFGDSTGGLQAIEVDSNIFNDSDKGTFQFAPQDRDSLGARYASTSDDDFVLGSNFVKNVPDIASLTVAGQRIVPQRQWSGFFARSRRAVDGIKERLEAASGNVDVHFLEQLLSDPQFVDVSDSMNAVVLDFEALQVRSAMGAVPATDALFEVTEVSP